MTEVPAVMSVRDIRKILDVTQQTVYKLIEEGKLEGFRVGNQWRIYKESFDQLIGASLENMPFRILVKETFTSEESVRRRALELRYRDGHDQATVAEELGVTESRVHTLIVNALLALRSQLKQRLTYDDVNDDKFALRVLSQLFLAQGEE